MEFTELLPQQWIRTASHKRYGKLEHLAFSMSPRFLSCDWGTSHFRLRLVDQANLSVLAEITTNEGTAHLSQQATGKNRADLFANTLARHIAAIFAKTRGTTTACVVSGMASSSIGWVDLPYAVAPMPLRPDNFVKQTLVLPIGGETVSVTLISGVRTNDDVMRGEECELYGLLELHPELVSSRVCVLLPGTHSKHVHLHERTLENFLTYMTGEIFAHLQSLPTLKGPLAVAEETSTAEFCEGVLTAQRHGLLAGLFKIRTRALISPREGLHAPSFLSGLLIGAELLSLRAPEATNVFLAGSPKLHPLYILAGEQIDRPLLSISPEILRRSLLHAHRNLLPS